MTDLDRIVETVKARHAAGAPAEVVPLHARHDAASPGPHAAEVSANGAAPGGGTATPGRRTLGVTRASDIEIRPVRWAWEGRLAVGTLALLAGREGLGKSIVASQLVADITRGRLQGAYAGQPRSVIVAATEDSWSHTIVPRLMAAGADLTRVLRVDVVTAGGAGGQLILPSDLPGLQRITEQHDVALILLDPLISRLDASLDTHRDAEVRLALEPIVALAEATDALVLGIIHVNKRGGTDPLDAVMASRAFSAVARAVLFVAADPDVENLRLLGQPKNNLGRTDLPTLAFRIVGHHVADTPEGPVWTGALRWVGEQARTIREVLEAAAEPADVRSATDEAGDWLLDYLFSEGGSAERADVVREGKRFAHSESSLKRAAAKRRVRIEVGGFPRRSRWYHPDSPPPGEGQDGSS